MTQHLEEVLAKVDFGSIERIDAQEALQLHRSLNALVEEQLDSDDIDPSNVPLLSAVVNFAFALSPFTWDQPVGMVPQKRRDPEVQAELKRCSMLLRLEAAAQGISLGSMKTG